MELYEELVLEVIEFDDEDILVGSDIQLPIGP